MKKPKYLYHGSSMKLKGNKIIPKKAKGVGEYNTQRGVYATHIKQAAISMALIADPRVKNSSLSIISNKKAKGIIYEGEIKSKYFYLYTLSSKDFTKVPKDMWQWISYNSVKPVKSEKLEVSDYISLVRKATNKEKEKIKKTLKWLRIKEKKRGK